MEPLKNCTNCKHLANKKSIDDVPDQCYTCVSYERSFGYYPNWEPRGADLPVTEEEEEEWVRREMGWQGGTITFREAGVKQDNVNSPAHYTTGGIETIDYIKAKLGVEGTINYCMGNVMKYTSRWQDKNGIEDLKKAQWYLNYAINLMKENNVHQ